MHRGEHCAKTVYGRGPVHAWAAGDMPAPAAWRREGGTLRIPPHQGVSRPPKRPFSHRNGFCAAFGGDNAPGWSMALRLVRCRPVTARIFGVLGVRGRAGANYDVANCQAARALSTVLKRSRTMGLLPTSSIWRPLGWTSASWAARHMQRGAVRHESRVSVHVGWTDA